MKRVFVIGGMSESGKSSLGKYLDSQGIPRLKIVTFLRRAMEDAGAEGDFYAWNDRQEQEQPLWLQEQFLQKFLDFVEKEGIEYCCLESLYRPGFGAFLKEQLGNRCVIVYVDIPLDIRLERQMIRENLATLEQAEQLLLPRDEKKREWGVPQIEPLADEVIDNSGTLEELQREGDRLIRTYCM